MVGWMVKWQLAIHPSIPWQGGNDRFLPPAAGVCDGGRGGGGGGRGDERGVGGMDGRLAGGHYLEKWPLSSDGCPLPIHIVHITHIDYLPFSTLRVDSSFKSNLVPLLYCHLIDLGDLWTFPKMIKFWTYEKKKVNNHAMKRVKWVRFLQSLQSGNEKH